MTDPAAIRPPSSAPPARDGAAEAVFPGDTEMARRCRAFDWGATPLGPVTAWPEGLRTAAGLVVAAPVGMVLLWGPDLVQVYNDAYAAVMGAKHPGGLGQPTRACWPEVWDFTGPIYDAVRRGEALVFTDQRLVLARGGAPEETYFTLAYSPVRDAAGGAPVGETAVGGPGVAGVLVTVVETTTQVRAQGARERERTQERERLLAESEAARAQVTATLESIGDAFYAVDRDFRFTYVNRRAEELWGRPRETLLGRHYWTEFPRAVDTEPYRRHVAAMAERRPAHFEAVSPLVGRWVDVSLYPDAATGGLACYFRDATERKQAEAALRASEGRFRQMADAVPQIVWTTDPDGRVEFFNRQWTAYTGAPYEPTTAAEVAAAFVHPDDGPATAAAFEEARRTGGAFAVEHRIRSAAGAYRWFLVRAEPSRDPDTGAVVRWFGASVDIHDRKTTEAALRASEARQAFLLALQDRLRPLADPAQIQYEAARLVGEHLGASRVGYAEIAADDAHTVVTRHYTDGVPGMQGRYRVDDYGPALLAALRAGRTVVQGDIAGDPALTPAEQAAHAALSIGAAVDVPLVKAGRLAAVLFMHHREARTWAPDELALLEAVAERTWDAVERARSESALRASEARFRAVEDASPDAVLLLRPVYADGHPDGPITDFEFVYGNPAAGRVLGGGAADAFVGRRMLAVFPSSAAEGYFGAYARVFATGEPYTREDRYVRDGLDVGVRVTAVRAGDLVHLRHEDIGGRLRAEAERARLLADAEAARAEAERRAGVLAAVIQSMPDAVYVGTMAGVTIANRAALELLGYDTLSELNRGIPTLAEEIRTRDPVTGRRLAPEEEAFVRALLGEGRVTQEVLIRHRRTGQDRLVHAVAMPVRGPGGAVAAAVTVSRDVTEARAAAAERERLLAESEAANAQLADANVRLQAQAAELAAQAEVLQTTAAELEERTEAADRARAEAEAANRAKGDFLAVMSHELRTPLNAIGGYAQLMELGLQGPVTPEQLGALSRIQRGQQHLLGLINAVLNYAKLEAGHVQYHAADVPAAEVLAEAAALVAPQARAKGLALAVAPCDPGLVARADAEKVGQVLLNLLSNAVKFTRGGGAITVGGGRAPDGRVALAVADTGRGIAADQLARVFEPFVQVDQRLTRGEEGTGLGLAISRDLARGMGGDLTAESTPGVGSTFTLTLPAA